MPDLYSAWRVMDAILPAAGEASRMRGLPKFLLPCDDIYTTLIERHILQLTNLCERIWVPTRPDLVSLLESLNLPKDKVIVLPISTKSMTETVLKVNEVAAADYYQLVMPDTYFSGEEPYLKLSKTPDFVELACWRIRAELPRADNPSDG